MNNPYASKNRSNPSKNRSIQNVIYNKQTHLKIESYPPKNRIASKNRIIRLKIESALTSKNRGILD